MAKYFHNIQHQDLSTAGKPWTQITQPIEIETREGIESVIDTFSFKIADKYIPHDTHFEDQDNIHIAFSNMSNPTVVDFDGLITALELNQSEGGKVWTIKGNNRFEYLMGYQRPTALTWTTSFSACSLLLAQVNDANRGNTDWVTLVWNPSNVATSFSFNLYRPYKPVYQHIEELSKNEYTHLGNFIYFFDGGSVFTWKTKPTSITGSFVEGFDFNSDKATKASYDVVNAAIIHAGNDFNGKPIYRFVCNYNSVGKLGFKWKYYEDVKLAEKIKSDKAVTVDNTFPFGDATDYTGGNAAFRNDVGSAVKAKWSPLIIKMGYPRWKADIETRGTTNHVLGDQYKIISPILGWDDGKEMRLHERTQTFNKNGWVARLSFEQDEEIAATEWD